MNDTLQLDRWTFGPVYWGEENKPGTLVVHCGSGHWSQTIDTKTYTVGGKTVYNWEATWWSTDRQEFHPTNITRAQLRYLRTLPMASDAEHAAAAASETA